MRRRVHSILPSSFSTKRSSSTPCKSWLVSYWVVGQFTTCCCSQSVSHMHFGHLALPVKSPPALAGMQSSSMIQGLTLSRFYHSLTGGQILNPPLKLRFVVPEPNFESNSNPLFSRTPTYLFFTNFPLYKAPFGSTQ